MDSDSHEPIEDGLIGKYLAGETNEEETQRVRKWLSESDAEREMQRFEKIWETSRNLQTRPPVDADAAWEKLRNRIHEPAPVADTPVRRFTPWRTSIAAAVVLVVGLGWLFWTLQRNASVPQLAFTATDHSTVHELPDGSKVWLNRNSKLEYPETFADDFRSVVLTGEAFFDITPNKEKPFRIQASQTTVQVVGTSFSVRAYDPNVRVAVRTGKVVFKARNAEVTLVKDQQATFDAQAATMQKTERLDPNVFTYQTGKAVFDNATLREVVQMIHEVYQADVQLGNESLRNCPTTIAFDRTKDTLENLLQAIADSHGLTIRRQGTQFIFEGTGCSP
ncbi:FecR domain-containing protein [Siphonobacter sp.]|uniref:FecR domain-containing protein n=1 Tax=Siphonobacter sp. TaxID=1869184 RepID=UPI003B3B9281